MVGYFLMNWKPQILVNCRHDPDPGQLCRHRQRRVRHARPPVHRLLSSAGSKRPRLTAIYFAMLVVTLVVFGTVPASPVVLLGTSGVLNLFTVGAYTGLFLVAIKYYSTEMRNSGVGFVVGWGRVGAIIGPMLGGLLIGARSIESMTFAVFASIAVIPSMSMFLAAGSTLTPEPPARAGHVEKERSA